MPDQHLTNLQEASGANAALSDDHLAWIVRKALQPSRFPFRRDIELASSVHEAEGSVCFHDYFWLQPQMLAMMAVRLHSAGLEGALQGAALKQLLRAAFLCSADPAAVIEQCRHTFPALHFDLAIAKLDATSGNLTHATHGKAAITRSRGEPSSDTGDIVWLVAGDMIAPSQAVLPSGGVDELLRTAIAADAQGCITALLIRGLGHRPDSVTYVLPNDARAIPGLLEKVNAFFLSIDGVLPDDVDGIDVAIEEVLANAISYGFADGNAHEMVVELTAEASSLLIEIRDDGIAFDPLGVPPPNLSDDLDLREVGGLGMHFVRTLLDEVGYRRVKGWNVLTLRKRLARAATHEATRS